MEVRQKIAVLPRTKDGKFIISPSPHYLASSCCILSAYMRVVDDPYYREEALNSLCNPAAAAALAMGMSSEEFNCVPYRAMEGDVFVAGYEDFQTASADAWKLARAFDARDEHGFDLHEALGLSEKEV